MAQCIGDVVALNCAGIMEGTFDSKSLPPEILQCMERLWPVIWTWLKTVLRQILCAHCSMPQRVGYRMAFVGLVRSLHCVQWIQEQLLLPTTDFRGKIIQVWKLDIQDPMLALVARQDPSASIADILNSCFIAIADESEEAWKDKVLSEFGNDPKVFASILLSHLQNNNKLHDLDKLIHDMDIITIPSQIHSLLDALLAQNSMVETIKHLTALTKRSSTDEPKLVATAMEYCLYNLLQTFQNGEGTPTILQALNSRILEALAGCARWSEDIDPAVFSILSKYLPSYLGYRSVVLSASRALRKMNDPRHGMTGRLAESWTVFVEALERAMSLIKSASPNNADDHLRELCSNMTVSFCPTSFWTPPNVNQVSGKYYTGELQVMCRLVSSSTNGNRQCISLFTRPSRHVLYCSKACQTHDWKYDHHKEECTIIQEHWNSACYCTSISGICS